MFKHLINTSEDEEIRIESNEEFDERVAFCIKEENPVSTKATNRLGGTLSTKSTQEKPQIFKDLKCLNPYPLKSNISEEFFSEPRFKSFIDTFTTLYTKVKANLLRNKNFNHKYKERCQRIIEVYQQKGLVKETYSCSSNVRQQLANAASLNERIEELHAKTKEKEAMIKLKEKIAKEASENKRLLQGEIQASVDERMEKLNQILQSFDKCTRSDLAAIPTNYEKLSENEKQLLEVLLHIIFLKDVPDAKFSSFVTKTLGIIAEKEQLTSILRARRDTNFTEATIKKIKNFTQKYSDSKFDKHIFKLTTRFLQALVKKFNLKVMLESRYEKLEETNQVKCYKILSFSSYYLYVPNQNI